MPKTAGRFPLKVASVIWRGEINDDERPAYTAVYVPMPDAAWEDFRALVGRYASELNLYQGATIDVATARLNRVRKAVIALQETIESANTPDMSFAATSMVAAHWQDHRTSKPIDFESVVSVVNDRLQVALEGGDTQSIAEDITDTIWPWIEQPPGVEDFLVMLQRYYDATVSILLNPGIAREPHAEFLTRLHAWAGAHGLKNGVSEANPGPLIRLAQKVRSTIPKDIRPARIKDGSLASRLEKLLELQNGGSKGKGARD